MRTISNYKALASVPGDDRSKLKALAAAVSLDLSLPTLCAEIMGERVTDLMGAKGGAVRRFAANEPVIPSVERIKSYLATKWATPSDTPYLSDVAQRVESFFHTNMPEVDLGWQNLFTALDLRGSNQDQFDITTTNAGISWAQIKPGGAVNPRREITEWQTNVPYLTFAAGLGLLDDWLRFQKFWRVEEAVAEFRATGFDKQAELHYGLFTALSSGVNESFATDDTQTFNNAASSILRNVRSSGYAVGQSARFWILTPPEKLGRILRMLEATQGSGIVANQASVQPIAYSVAGVIASTHIPAASTGYYLVLPGRKIQRGTWLDLSVESKRDIYTRAEDMVGTQQFNAIIGDSNQVRRVLFS